MIEYPTPKDIGRGFYLIIGHRIYGSLLHCEFIGFSFLPPESCFKFRRGQDVWGVMTEDLKNVFYTKEDAESELYDRRHPFDPSYYEEDIISKWASDGKKCGWAPISDEFLAKWGIKRKEQKMITKEDLDKQEKAILELREQVCEAEKKFTTMKEEYECRRHECKKEMGTCHWQEWRLRNVFCNQIILCCFSTTVNCKHAGQEKLSVSKNTWKCVPE